MMFNVISLSHEFRPYYQMTIYLAFPPVIEVKSKRVFAVDSVHPPFPRRLLRWCGRGT